jgi:uncharacterized membrane protein
MATSVDSTPPATVRLAQLVEESALLDLPIKVLKPLATKLLDSPDREYALRGMWLGHAIHPLLTDLPLGMWTSATVLDLLGGSDSRGSARKLVGLGIAASVPTAVTGFAEWGATDGQRERRVGVVHAVANSTALALYTASWRARRRDIGSGKLLAIAGGLAGVVGGFFGGHLTEVRKVSSHHPAFDDSGVGV